MSKLKNVRVLTIASMLVAISILLGFFKIPITNNIQIQFSFLAIALSAALFGPGIGAVVGMLSDIGAFIVNPTGPYFIGFTISATLAGVLFGLVFYQKEWSFKRIVCGQILYNLIIGLVINSINLYFLYGNGFLYLVAIRFTKEMVMIPIDAILLLVVLKACDKTSMKRSVIAHE